MLMQSFKYKIVDPNDALLMEQIFRLRFQVYGHEKNFIPIEDYPDGLETDEHDGHAVHIAALNDFNEVVGSVRLIFNKQCTLPIERHVDHINLEPPEPHVLCFTEISRLVISKQMRQRDLVKIDQSARMNSEVMSARKQFLQFTSPMVFGMCQMAYQVSMERGVTHWLCLMERSLHSLLHKYGFPFVCIGREIDFYGRVNPYIADVTQFKNRLEQYHRDVQTTDLVSYQKFSLS